MFHVLLVRSEVVCVCVDVVGCFCMLLSLFVVVLRVFPGACSIEHALAVGPPRVELTAHLFVSDARAKAAVVNRTHHSQADEGIDIPTCGCVRGVLFGCKLAG